MIRPTAINEIETNSLNTLSLKERAGGGDGVTPGKQAFHWQTGFFTGKRFSYQQKV